MLKGKVHKYGANVNTDAIIPARWDRVNGESKRLFSKGIKRGEAPLRNSLPSPL